MFGKPDRSYFVTELIALAGVGRGSVQSELSRLARSKLVGIKRQGNQKHYLANPNSPIFEELCSIIRKTVGIEALLRSALERLESHIELALIYGSTAKHIDNANSDIDLLMVSDEFTLEELYTILSNVEPQVSQKVNPTLYTKKEFQKRQSNSDSFLSRVLAGPIIVLEGQ